MKPWREKKISRWLSYVLRHNPQSIGLSLDSYGWADVDQLLQAAAAHSFPVTRQELEWVVAHNDKQRFAWSEDRQRIRAVHGHSIPIQMEEQDSALKPPEVLYHGTATRFLSSIRRQGLLNQGRAFVHLSADPQTAMQVGRRHGKPVLLTIQAQKMANNGHRFFRSTSGIWLTKRVPIEYIQFPEHRM